MDQNQSNHGIAACYQQWQEAELAMTIARRCFEGWLRVSPEAMPSTAASEIMLAYHTHEALHEAVRAISLVIDALRVEAGHVSRRVHGGQPVHLE